MAIISSKTVLFNDLKHDISKLRTDADILTGNPAIDEALQTVRIYLRQADESLDCAIRAYSGGIL